MGLFGKRAAIGYNSIKPVLNEAGAERFGLIELAPSLQSPRKNKSLEPLVTAALKLSGPKLNSQLSDNNAEARLWLSLVKALPYNCPSQFLLVRRPGSLEAAYEHMQAGVKSHLHDKDIAYSFLDEYLEQFLYPTEEAGLVEQELFVLISGRGEEEVGDRMAELMVALECEAEPVMAERLAELLTASADFVPIEGGAANPDGQRRAYWTLGALPTLMPGSWTGDLLSDPNLADLHLTFSVSLYPVPFDPTKAELISRKIASYEQTLAQVEQADNRAKLRGEIENLRRQLASIKAGEKRDFELNLTIALQADQQNFEQDAELLEAAMYQVGLTPRRILEPQAVSAAIISTSPLNAGQKSAAFCVPAEEAGRIVHLAETSFDSESSQSAILLSSTPTLQPFYLDTAPATNLVLTGEDDSGAGHRTVKYVAAMQAMQGQPLFAVDLGNEWAGLVGQQLGGIGIEFGPESQWHFNPLTDQQLITLGQAETWISRAGSFLTVLLELDATERDNLAAVLLSAAIAQQSEAQALSPANLIERAVNGGYEALAQRLQTLLPGQTFGWLCDRPTNLPTFEEARLLAVGFAPDVQAAMLVAARRKLLGRVLTQLLPERQAGLVIADDLTVMLDESEAVNALASAWKNPALQTWFVAGCADDLLDNVCGRTIIDQASRHLIFQQSGIGVVGLAKRLKLSARAVRAIRELEPGGLFIRNSANELATCRAASGHYLDRFGRPRAIPAVIPTPKPASKSPTLPLLTAGIVTPAPRVKITA